eukprot:11670355-Alexandrium_andersonii.AAC.1
MSSLGGAGRRLALRASPLPAPWKVDGCPPGSEFVLRTTDVLENSPSVKRRTSNKTPPSVLHSGLCGTQKRNGLTESTAVRTRPFYAQLRLSHMQRVGHAAFGPRHMLTCANARSPNNA